MSCQELSTRYPDLTGKRFGKLTVLEQVETPAHIKRKGKRYWLCRCDCGNEIKVRTNSLTTNHSTQCKTCANAALGTGTEDVPGWYFCEVINSARYRKHSFNLVVQDLQDEFTRQAKKCSLTGRELCLIISSKRCTKTRVIENTASLDRINSEIGYEKGNIQWLHKEIQNMKQKFTQSQFIANCLEVVRHQIKKGVLRAEDVL